MRPSLLVGACALAACAPTAARLRADRARERAHTPATARASDARARAVAAAAVEAPPRCDDVRVRAYNHQICCADVKDVLAPASVDELVQLVQRTRPHPLRVVGSSHSSNEQICTDGYAISMANFNHIYGLKRHDGVEYVEVDAGVRMGELNRWLDAEGRSIGFVTIGFRGITMGGGLATGVHGSSLRHPSVLSSRLEYVQFVDGEGHLRELYRPRPAQAPPPAAARRLRTGFLPTGAPPRRAAAATAVDPVERDRFRAFAASVGMLGIVTKVGLRTEPRFNLDVQLDFDKADTLFEKGVEKLVGDCDWGQIVYLPRANRIARFCGMRTLEEPMAGASNTLLTPHVDPGSVGAFRELMEDTIANGAYLCLIESERYQQLKMYPPFVRDCCCKRKYERHVIGPGDLMMSSELTEYHDQLPEIDYEVAIPLSEVPAALARVRDYARAERLCMPLIGLFLRFSPVDDNTLIGHSVTDDRAFKDQKVMFLEFVVYVLQPGENEEEWQRQESEYYKKYRDLALQLVQYHHGRPHWGKNQVPVFQLHKELDERYRQRLQEFHCWVREYDPEQRFANQFSRTVDLTPPAASDGTAPRGEACARALSARPQ
jgi:hypothetical protein